MLVLTRKAGEAIHIGGDVFIRVIQTKAGRVRLGIEAPQEVQVTRGEFLDGTSNRLQPVHANVCVVNETGTTDEGLCSTMARRFAK